MAKKTKIFDQAKDKNVANLVVFGKSADSKLYYESTYTNQVDQAVAEDAFLKGRLVIKVGDNYVYPMSLASHKLKTIDATGTSTVTVTFVEWQTKSPS